MNLKSLRQILKVFADDTRLRIINIISRRELTVKDICAALRINQPTISKHLVRLRLLKIVKDRRAGNLIYYSLNPNSEAVKIAGFLFTKFKHLEVFKKDRARAFH